MKATLIFICALLALSVRAASPLFSQFDTNSFASDPLAGYVRANTNASNPNALATKGDLNGSSNALNSAIQSASSTANLAVVTNDSRKLILGNSANQISGTLSGSALGTFIQSNSLVTGTANPFRIGFNSGIGFYVSGTTAGQETSVGLLSPWENVVDYGNGFPAFSAYDGVAGDYTFRFYRMISTLPTTNPDPTKHTVAGVRYGNIGAQQTIYAPFIGGSAGSLIDLPSHDGAEFHSAMPKPWLGVYTDDTTGTATDSNPGPEMTNYLYLTNMSYFFETSGITAALNTYGTAPNIWGDCGWEQTNRTSDGVIQVNTNLFPFGFQNEISIVHSHGTTLTLHIYQTANLPNQFPNLVATVPDMAWRTSLGGHFWNSYPSGTGAQAGYQTNFTYPAITPDTVQVDLLWFYTNGVDGIMDADLDSQEAESQGYEHYRLASVGDAILYPLTKNSGRTAWRNWTPPDSGGNNGAIATTSFTNSPSLHHQLWFGYFVNHSGSETPYYANFISPDQSPGNVSSDSLFGMAMSYAQLYENMGATNWPIGTFGFAGTHDFGLGITMGQWTNWYSVVGEFNFCSASLWYTNAWNTNQTPIVTNANFLATWTDTTGGWPKPVFCDSFVDVAGKDYEGTNSLWIRQLKDGYAVLASNLGTVSSNYNSSLVINGGVATNQVYCATNILTQTPFGTGLLTNNFIGTIGAASRAWVKLTPYSINGNFVGNGAGVTNTPFSNLNLSLVIGSGSNNVVGYLNFTNNRIHYTIPVCTNAVP